MSTLAEKIAVMQAHADGKVIQFRGSSCHGPHVWTDVLQPLWAWNSRDYRVKPKRKSPRVKTERTSPRAFRIGFDSGGSTTGLQYHGRPMRVSSRPTCESAMFVEIIDQ